MKKSLFIIIAVLALALAFGSGFASITTSSELLPLDIIIGDICVVSSIVASLGATLTFTLFSFLGITLVYIIFRFMLGAVYSASSENIPVSEMLNVSKGLPAMVGRLISFSCFLISWRLRVWPVVVYFLYAIIGFIAWTGFGQSFVGIFDYLVLGVAFILVPAVFLLISKGLWFEVPTQADLRNLVEKNRK